MVKKTINVIKTVIRTTKTLAVMAAVMISSNLQADQPIKDAESLRVEHSLVSMGDTTRLKQVFAKARRGEAIVVGTIGGSITAGASATQAEKRWANLVAQWWRNNFPKAKITFINAGIGATASDYGAHRAPTHLLVYKPDFVVVEFAVNDPNTQPFAETLEGLTRQILSQPQKPAVMLLFTVPQHGQNAQEWQEKVGKHYGLPMVSLRNGIWPDIQLGKLSWNDIGAPDGIHPNDRCHGYCASFINAVLGDALSHLAPDGQLAAVAPLPKPLFSDTYEHVALFNADSIVPKSNTWWSASASSVGHCWETNKPGSVLEFEIEGTVVRLMFKRVKGDMGIAEVVIDQEPAMRINGWFACFGCWGGSIFRLRNHF